MDQAHPNRRAFLKAGGLGVTAAGVGALAGAKPADAWVIPLAFDLRQHFGATGNGTTDDTEAIRAAFAAFNNTPAGVKGAYIHVPPGDYLISDTIDITQFAGIIQGAGVGNTLNYAPSANGGGFGTSFRWGGPAGVPMFRLRNCRHLSFRDLRFVGDDAAVPSAAINVHNGGGDTIGTNAELSFLDCVFGVWPWSHDVTYRGRLEHGILYDGVNTNNDKFRILRCSFSGKSDLGAGITIRGTQSIWGSITDCLFTELRVGVSTASNTTITNPGFLGCGTDVEVNSFADVDVHSWNSERSGRIARVNRHGGLRVTGGTIQLVPNRIEQVSGGTSGGLVDAFPSGHRQTVSFTGTRFLWPAGESTSNRPTICFGPTGPSSEHPSGVPAGHEGFLIRVSDCMGLYASQCELKGTMEWASEPRSRGLVEWYSRNRQGVVQFRNELWNGDQPGTRNTVDPSAWDPPVPGNND